MTTALAEHDESTTTPPLATLATHLRDGPLQRLLDLQAKTEELASRMHGDDPRQHLEDLAELVELSLAAMEHFHAFTREFQTLVADLADATARH